MNFGKENDIVHTLTAPPKNESEGKKGRDVSALVEYLRHDMAGRYLLDALADMLDKDGNSIWQLRLVRRDKRHIDNSETVERKSAAYKRVRELTGLIADRVLVDDIVKGLRTKWRGSSWKAEPQKERWLLQENGVTMADIAADEPLDEAVAKKIAAAEHGFSYGTFRDNYRDIERSILTD